MAENPSRRSLLKGIAAISATAAVEGASLPEQQAGSRPADADELIIPTNRLGRTGAQITRLGLGGGYPSYSTRHIGIAYRNGIRYFDTAYGYGNGQQERTLGEWISGSGLRSDVFVVDKDGICAPEQFYEKVVRALERLQIDTIDLYMIHALDDPGVPLDADKAWSRLKQRLVREKKIRFMGFSTHADMPQRVQCLANAARGGWVDAIMVAVDPLLLKTSDDLNRAVDACVKADIGLIAMKTTRGLGKKAAERLGVPEGQAETEKMAGFDAAGLSAFGAVHYGMWSDGRFAAICSAMLSVGMLEENARNARQFKPLNKSQLEALEEGMRRLTRTICPGCDGSCRHAAGTETDFASISRYLAYARDDGNRRAAREWYHALHPAQRSCAGADLEGASAACPAKLDFVQILQDAERLLA